MSSKYEGKFIWYDVMTTDVPAAKAFYTKVVGWEASDSDTAGQDYVHFAANGVPMGGLMELQADAKARGVPPCWNGYIGVSDVDDCVTRIKAAGGSVLREAQDIPGVGRFAVVADPGGAAFIVMRGFSEQPMPEIPPTAPGHVGWRELQAHDLQKAFDFYATVFGWTKSDAMDMGPMVVYQMFKTGGEWAVGGMMTRMPDIQWPYWLYYFNVDAIDAAVTRITENGGRIVHGPSEVPGPMFIVQALDPQGALFALVAPKR